MFQAAKVIRLIFTFVFLAVLLLCYAYLPLTLDINIEGSQRIGRELFFYVAIGLFLLVNLSTYFLRNNATGLTSAPKKKLLIHLLAPVLYFSMAMLIGFLTVVNNPQDVSVISFNYLNYLAAGLVLAWIFSFLFVSIKKI